MLGDRDWRMSRGGRGLLIPSVSWLSIDVLHNTHDSCEAQGGFHHAHVLHLVHMAYSVIFDLKSAAHVLYVLYVMCLCVCAPHSHIYKWICTQKTDMMFVENPVSGCIKRQSLYQLCS